MKKHPKQPLRLDEMGGEVDPGSILRFDRTTGLGTQFAKSALKTDDDVRRLVDDGYARRRDVPFYCGCRNLNPAACYPRKTDGVLHLGSCPIRGREHAPDCENWPPELGPLSAWPSSQQSVEPMLDAIFHPRLVHSRAINASNATAEPQQGASRKRYISTDSGSLLALLHASQLNHFVPGRPSDWDALAPILSATLDGLAASYLRNQTVAVERPRMVSDASLVNVHLLPVGGFRGGRAVQPAMLIGSIARATPDGDEVLVYLEDESTPVHFEQQAWQYAIRHSAAVHTRATLEALTVGVKTARVLGAFAVTWDGGRRLLGHRAGLCVTTRELVPTESSLELEVFNDLIADEREFIKDIYRPRGAEYRHDARLLDTKQEVKMEINGFKDPAYEKVKEKNEAYLKREHPDRHWIWWACRGESKPDYPGRGE